ncbi:hypothetical protein A33K_17380 [Burkholderia humptydooensis MSMB43]|uniref:Uncharacterized protein n=1 Tax=Burkholderia humptydooensis MSMB43 TaxID=441157 RepID=A0ABN0G2E5_9BURK|nr:hypothetical protein A33K_17380 [Burkholderia humptydooensis MSMB43]
MRFAMFDSRRAVREARRDDRAGGRPPHAPSHRGFPRPHQGLPQRPRLFLYFIRLRRKRTERAADALERQPDADRDDDADPARRRSQPDSHR